MEMFYQKENTYLNSGFTKTISVSQQGPQAARVWKTPHTHGSIWVNGQGKKEILLFVQLAFRKNVFLSASIVIF